MSLVATPSTSPLMRAALAGAMAVVLIVLAPLGPALEIHHALAAADDDGHEHSASDLCQWVQYHTGQSVLTALPTFASSLAIAPYEPTGLAVLLSARLLSSSHSRAPPVL